MPEREREEPLLFEPEDRELEEREPDELRAELFDELREPPLDRAEDREDPDDERLTFERDEPEPDELRAELREDRLEPELERAEGREDPEDERLTFERDEPEELGRDARGGREPEAEPRTVERLTEPRLVVEGGLLAGGRLDVVGRLARGGRDVLGFDRETVLPEPDDPRVVLVFGAGRRVGAAVLRVGVRLELGAVRSTERVEDGGRLRTVFDSLDPLRVTVRSVDRQVEGARVVFSEPPLRTPSTITFEGPRSSTAVEPERRTVVDLTPRVVVRSTVVT